MHEWNKEIVRDILTTLPVERKQTLINALRRNYMLTSTYDLSHLTLTVYVEGFYVELDGTRCGFKVFAKDNDGKLEITRKPAETRLHKLYSVYSSTWEVINLDSKEFWR